MTLTRREFGQRTAGATAGALALSMTGCGNGGLITALDVCEVACTATLPFSAALGPAAAYITAISTACSKSVTELQNTADSQAQQYTVVAGYFLAVAAVGLPPGTSVEVQAIFGAVVAAVSIILQLVNKTPAPTPAPAVQAKLRQYRIQVNALGSDKARMADIKDKHAKLVR